MAKAAAGQALPETIADVAVVKASGETVALKALGARVTEAGNTEGAMDDLQNGAWKSFSAHRRALTSRSA